MSLRTTLGHIRGHGSAKTGTRQGALQRLTALALVPLTLWLVISVVAHVGSSYEHMHAWLSSPWTSSLLLLLLATGLVHAQLGLQMVIDDYVQGVCVKSWTVIAVKFATALIGIYAAVSVLRAAFVGV